MTKTPEDESEHLPPDDEEEEKEAHDDCVEEPAGPPAPGAEEPRD